jgi:hypothetical protein
MGHLLGQHDRYLHHPDGSHRMTPPTTDGSVLARYERRIKEHLAEHEKERDDHDRRTHA